jgi:hypothetical protein
MSGQLRFLDDIPRAKSAAAPRAVAGSIAAHNSFGLITGSGDSRGLTPVETIASSIIIFPASPS